MDNKKEANLDKRLAILKRSRTGKKGVITKRIQKLEGLVSECGKRKIIRPLLTGLERVFNELVQVCNEITHLSDDVDPLNCIEEIRDNVEVCIIETKEHLEERKDEPDSSGSYTSSWAEKHAELMSVGTGADFEDAIGGEVDLVPKQEFFTPEGGSRALDHGITNGGDRRGETDPPIFRRDEVMENGAVDIIPGMSFDSLSDPRETAVPPAAEEERDETTKSRMSVPRNVESYALSESSLDATVTGEEIYGEESEKVKNLHGDRALNTEKGLEPHTGHGVDMHEMGKGLVPNPDVRLRTIPETEKDRVSEVIVDSLSGKFRDLTFGSPNHGVISTTPYDGGGIQRDKGDGVSDMTPMSSGGQSDQFWDSVWGTWDPNAQSRPGVISGPATDPIYSSSLLKTTLVPPTSHPVGPSSWPMSLEPRDASSLNTPFCAPPGIGGFPQVNGETFLGTGTSENSGKFGEFTTSVNNIPVTVVNQPPLETESFESGATGTEESRLQGTGDSLPVPSDSTTGYPPNLASPCDSSQGSVICNPGP